MPNRITNVVTPASVRAGDEFDVTVEYTADQGGDVLIQYTGSFGGTPGSEPLDGAQVSKTFKMTIARYGAAPLCRVEFRFGNLRPCLIEVT